MADRAFWDSQISIANSVRKVLDSKPDAFKKGYQISPGGILNAFREGDLNFQEAIEALTTWHKNESESSEAAKIRTGKCIECGHKVDIHDNGSHYWWMCPRCGARMIDKASIEKAMSQDKERIKQIIEYHCIIYNDKLMMLSLYGKDSAVWQEHYCKRALKKFIDDAAESILNSSIMKRRS